MTTVNWDQLRSQAATGPELLPKGDYVGSAKSAQAKKTNDGTKDMIVVQFQILSGPAAGKTLWNNFTLSPENANALGFFFEHLAALGISEAAFAQQPTFEILASWIEQLARPVILSVSHRQWQGQLRNQVDGIRPYGGDGHASVPPAPGAIAAPPQAPVPPAAPAPVAPPAPAPVPAVPAPAPVAAPVAPVAAPIPVPGPVAPAPVAAPVAPVAAPIPVPGPVAPPPPPAPVQAPVAAPSMPAPPPPPPAPTAASAEVPF